MKKLALAAILMGSVVAHAEAPAKFQTSCGVCHTAGVANAPKVGDAAAWQARMDTKGSIDALVESVKKGLNAMPPGGMCNGCSDDEYKELIEYMMKGA